MNRTRLSDQETVRRMLDAAIELVHQRGISTGLEAITFDEVVHKAGVSRTSAYRRWPKRDLFYNEILLELASGATLPIAAESKLVGAAAQDVFGRIKNPESPRGHRDLVVELLRVTSDADYEAVSTSTGRRTYHMLLSSYRGITDPEVRDKVGKLLADAERCTLEIRGRIYAEFTALLGYRLIPPLIGPSGFEMMGRAAGAIMNGLITQAELGDTGYKTFSKPRRMRAFGASIAAEWSPVAYMMTATQLGYIEPDPGIEWSKEHTENLMAAIEQFTLDYSTGSYS